MSGYGEILTLENLLDNFPHDIYPDLLPNQKLAFEKIAERTRSVVLEMPTGSGKTAVGYTMLKTLARAGQGPLFYIVPNKTLVDQVAQMHPDMTRVYGRSEYDCLYYRPEAEFKADEIPCLSLDCAHRVDQQTGETVGENVEPCPYYRAKFEAKKSQIVVCTAAFYLFTQLFSREFEAPAGLVIDEAHQIAKIVRGCLSYEVTDRHLKSAIKLLERIGAEDEAAELSIFLHVMINIIKTRMKGSSKLLLDEDLLELIEQLKRIDADSLSHHLRAAIAEGAIDVLKENEVLKSLERLTFDLKRYIHSFEYSLEADDRNALNFVTYAFIEKDRQDNQVEYRLSIKAYYVSPIVRRLLSPMTLAYSATIGDPGVFGFENGIQSGGRGFVFHSLPASFSSDKTRVFMPKDTPNLSKKKQIHQEPTKVLRRIAKSCDKLWQAGHRSMVVVVSNVEREKFLRLCQEEGVEAISYGEGVSARQAAERFKAGEATVLVGTTANYGEGIDLPEQIAPVIFFLRPGYPRPDDPTTQFEEKRFGNRRWGVWNWRVMIEALQTRGRNVRSANDRGVTIFISQQFRSFLYGALPEWLRPSYRNDLTLAQSVEQAIELLEE